jgi:predicted permease
MVGFTLVARRVLPGAALKALVPLALDIALPCTIFIHITRRFDPAATPGWWHLPLWWALFTAAAFALTMTVGTIVRPRHRNEFTATLFYQNALFFPMVILPRICPDTAPCLVYLFLFTVPFSAFFFGTAPLFFTRTSPANGRLKSFNPVVVATLLAVVLRLTGTHAFVPESAYGIIELLGGMAIPLLMLVIGGNLFIDSQQRRKVAVAEVAWFVTTKCVLFPLIALALLALLRPSYPLALIILLQSAVPPITAMPLVAERGGGDKTVVNQFLVATFAAAVVTLPIMTALLKLLYRG